MKVPNAYNEYANIKYISMLDEVLSIANLYYSNQEDLTRRVQGTSQWNLQSRYTM